MENKRQGVVVHTVNPALKSLSQYNHKFKASPGYREHIQASMSKVYGKWTKSSFEQVATEIIMRCSCGTLHWIELPVSLLAFAILCKSYCKVYIVFLLITSIPRLNQDILNFVRTAQIFWGANGTKLGSERKGVELHSVYPVTMDYVYSWPFCISWPYRMSQLEELFQMILFTFSFLYGRYHQSKF
jgi:hypothetical protein